MQKKKKKTYKPVRACIAQCLTEAARGTEVVLLAEWSRLLYRRPSLRPPLPTPSLYRSPPKGWNFINRASLGSGIWANVQDTKLREQKAKTFCTTSFVYLQDGVAIRSSLVSRLAFLIGLARAAIRGIPRALPVCRRISSCLTTATESTKPSSRTRMSAEGVSTANVREIVPFLWLAARLL